MSPVRLWKNSYIRKHRFEGSLTWTSVRPRLLGADQNRLSKHETPWEKLLVQPGPYRVTLHFTYHCENPISKEFPSTNAFVTRCWSSNHLAYLSLHVPRRPQHHYTPYTSVYQQLPLGEQLDSSLGHHLSGLGCVRQTKICNWRKKDISRHPSIACPAASHSHGTTTTLNSHPPSECPLHNPQRPPRHRHSLSPHHNHHHHPSPKLQTARTRT
jgi:hypothetical protein